MILLLTSSMSCVILVTVANLAAVEQASRRTGSSMKQTINEPVSVSQVACTHGLWRIACFLTKTGPVHSVRLRPIRGLYRSLSALSCSVGILSDESIAVLKLLLTLFPEIGFCNVPSVRIF